MQNMSETDWGAIFQNVRKEAPATDEDIAYLQHSVLAPLTEAEIAEVNKSQQNPFPLSDPLFDKYQPFDPTRWVIPQRQFPIAFVEFLRWSNGGEFNNGVWEFGMFDPKTIRGNLLSYQLPEYMPGAVPFAFDGCGGFFLFDMRDEPVDGEYPIVLSHSGSLGWDEDDHFVIANSFVQACTASIGPSGKD